MSETVEPIKTLPLVFDEPRGRRKPPPHLAASLASSMIQRR